MQNTSAAQVQSSEKGEARGKTYRIPISNGIFKHYPKIKDAMWLLLLYVDWTTREVRAADGSYDGIVLGGKPVSDAYVAGAFPVNGGPSERAIWTWRNLLAKHGYIEQKRTGSGYIITVKKSKKWPQSDPQKAQSRTEESSDLPTRELKKVQIRSDKSSDQIRKKFGTRSDSSVQCKDNAEKIVAAKTAAPPTPTITGWELTAPKAEHRGDPRFTPFKDYAFKAFEGRYGRKPSWGPKDYAGLKALLARSTATEEDLCQRFVNFLASTKQYVRDKGGSLAFFASEFDSFIEGPREDWKPVTFDEQRRKNGDEAMRKLAEQFGLDPAKLEPTFPALAPAATPALPERAGQLERLTERETLVLVMREPAALENDPWIRGLVAENFQHERHQVIFHGMKYLKRNGPALTLDTLIALLQRRGELDRAGGEGYIRALVDEPTRKAATA